jgi:hypothetical protein
MAALAGRMGMFEEMRGKISHEISAGLAFEELRQVYDIDRWFTFEAFKKSAAHIAGRFAAAGLSSKVEKFPADGKTRAGSWVLPLAWDVKDAWLVIEEPAALAGTVLARYRENPTSLAMWSGPTPGDGLRAELVWMKDADRAESYKKADLKGKVVFTSVRPNLAKGLAAGAGAAGVLSDFVPRPADLPDATFWMNAWSDNPGGWGLLDGESRIFGFNMSPRRGEWLRKTLDDYRRVVVRAVVQSKIHQGTLPAVTGVIQGERRGEEVLAIGHAFEQGAVDNAAGVAVMLEAARVLSKLIKEGVLPRPRRSIRFLVVSECYNTLAYSERFGRRLASTAAALCLDSVGEKQALSRTMLGLRKPPDSNASYITALAERLAEVTFEPWRGNFKWKPVPFSPIDNVIADPAIGPSTVWLGLHPSDLFWHTNQDTLDKVDVEALGKFAQYTAVYLYLTAAAGPVDALYFAAIAGARGRAQTARTAALCLEACRDGMIDIDTTRARVLYTARRGASEVESVRSLLTFKEAQTIDSEVSQIATALIDEGERIASGLERVMRQCKHKREIRKPSRHQKHLRKRAAAVIAKRKYIGTIAFDLLPAGERLPVGDPRWDTDVTAALFWCDGKRTLAEALELAGHEVGKDLFYLVDVFEYFAKKELIEMEKA